MISPEITNVLKSNYVEPSYAVMITDIQSISNCNNDKITITTEQINPHPIEVIKEQADIISDLKQLLTKNNITIPSTIGAERNINSVIEKQFTINSALDFDNTQSAFVSRLTGSINNEGSQQLESRIVEGSITSKVITLTTKDYPNYFNRSKFKMKGNTLIISIPKIINSVKCVVTTDGVPATYQLSTPIESNKLSIPITGDCTFKLSYSLKKDITMKTIEYVVTPFKKLLNIQFDNIYKKIPGIVITIDAEDKYYNTYDLSFDTNENNYYTGVTITFKMTRNKIVNKDINILIIGDKID